MNGASPPLVIAHWEQSRPNLLSPSSGCNTDAQAAQGLDPFAGQLRSKLFLCTDHKTLRITEHITRLLCPSSRPGPRHPPQQVCNRFDTLHNG